VFCLLAARADELRDNAAVARACVSCGQGRSAAGDPARTAAPDALRELIGAHAPGARCERLSMDCGGNPLLAIELARAEIAGDSGQTLGELVQERLAGFAGRRWRRPALGGRCSRQGSTPKRCRASRASTGTGSAKVLESRTAVDAAARGTGFSLFP
jgi:hypothetical protein